LLFKNEAVTGEAASIAIGLINAGNIDPSLNAELL